MNRLYHCIGRNLVGHRQAHVLRKSHGIQFCRVCYGSIALRKSSIGICTGPTWVQPVSSATEQILTICVLIRLLVLGRSCFNALQGLQLAFTKTRGVSNHANDHASVESTFPSQTKLWVALRAPTLLAGLIAHLAVSWCCICFGGWPADLSLRRILWEWP